MALEWTGWTRGGLSEWRCNRPAYECRERPVTDGDVSLRYEAGHAVQYPTDHPELYTYAAAIDNDDSHSDLTPSVVTCDADFDCGLK